MMEEKIRCSFCGRFVSIKDLDEGSACVRMITPDSHFTKEEYVTICKKCGNGVKINEV